MFSQLTAFFLDYNPTYKLLCFLKIIKFPLKLYTMPLGVYDSSIRSLIGFLQHKYIQALANVRSMNCRTLVTSITTIIGDINQNHRDIPLFRCQNLGRLLKTSRKVLKTR